MSIFWASLFITLLGNLASLQTNGEDNRLYSFEGSELNTQSTRRYGYRRPFLSTNRIYKSNDYDDHSSGFLGERASSQLRYPTTSHAHAKTPLKVYKPREDPRLFYQSDDYLKEVNGQNVNYEVASIYPGREVIRYGDFVRTPQVRRLRSRADDYSDDVYCVKCPQDRTLVAKAGYDRVTLQVPRLFMCTGLKAPKTMRFASLGGPKFGSLLEEGTYTIVGRVMNFNQNLQACKFKVHVISQSCHLPKSLVAHCKGLGRPCNFTCQDSRHELLGPSSLTCGDDLQWNGFLPTCKAPHWCPRPTPPNHGKITCIGNPAGENSQGLSEGSRCRVRCGHGWHSNPRVVSICRRGAWNHILTCKPKRNNDTTTKGLILHAVGGTTNTDLYS